MGNDRPGIGWFKFPYHIYKTGRDLTVPLKKPPVQPTPTKQNPHPPASNIPKKTGPGKSKNSKQRSSHDPNSIDGPQGYGAQGFVGSDEVLPYEILFANASTAEAAADIVTITETLSPNLDWSTFQLGTIQLGGLTITVPAGLSSYQTQLDETSTLGLILDVSAALDMKTGVVTWTLTGLDPTTLDISSNPNLGLLLPDDATGRGEGSVMYTVQPKSGLATGATIAASASIVFDTNAAIATPTISNTIDAAPPTTAVNPLPADSPPVFTLSWSGVDNPAGPGVASYDVYASVNGGTLTLVNSDITATSLTIEAPIGHTYAFAVVATDNVGLTVGLPTSAQVSTIIVSPTMTVALGSPAPVTAGATLSVAGSISDDVPGPYQATVNYGDGSGVANLTIAANGTFALSHVYAKPGAYEISVVATDGFQGETTQTIETTIVSPTMTVALGSPAPVTAGATLSVAGSISDDVPGPYQATVNYGDGSGVANLTIAANGTFTLSHAYAKAGDYQISVVAADGFGGEATQTIELTVTTPLPVSGLGAGRDAFVITLYRELLGIIPTESELIADARKLKNNAAYVKVGHSILESKAYKYLQRAHRGTGIPYSRAYRDAIVARNLAGPPVVGKKKH